MRTMQLAAICLVLGLATTAVGATSLETRDGTVITVQQQGGVVLPFGVAAPAIRSDRDVGLKYQVLSPNGDLSSGLVPGSRSFTGDLQPVLGQSPVTGDVFLVFVARQPAHLHSQLGFATWSGQGWSDWLPLTDFEAEDESPQLKFRAGGDAILSWMRDGELVLKHFELTRAGELAAYSFQAVGSPSSHLATLGGTEPRVQLVADPLADQVYVVLDDPWGTDSAVLGISLSQMEGGQGIGAVPVPVTFSNMDGLDGTGTGWEPGPVETVAVGARIEPYRLVLPTAQAVYWLEGEAVKAVVLGAPEQGLIAIPRPPQAEQAHFLIVRAVRLAVVGSLTGEDARAQRSGSPRGRGDRRR